MPHKSSPSLLRPLQALTYLLPSATLTENSDVEDFCGVRVPVAFVFGAGAAPHLALVVFSFIQACAQTSGVLQSGTRETLHEQRCSDSLHMQQKTCGREV
jgi:hypothetical protein